MKIYKCRIKQRRRIEREIPRERQGWWADICPGKTLLLRDATESDIARCFLTPGSSVNPEDYLCELPDNGSLVSRIALSKIEIYHRQNGKNQHGK